MAENSSIEWTDHTFNPWIGCTKVSPGCANCYAETSTPVRIHRSQGRELWGKGKPRQRTSAASWHQPSIWNARAKEDIARIKADIGNASEYNLVEYERPRVFCASLADWLDPEVPTAWRLDLLRLIHRTPNLDWLLLSKRLPHFNDALDNVLSVFEPQAEELNFACWLLNWRSGSAPPDNVRIGTSAEDQRRLDERLPHLHRIPARVRFLSCEPLLGPIALTPGRAKLVDWVIVGGESGPNARPMNPHWARMIRDDCGAAGVPFHFKQWGEWHPAPGVPPRAPGIAKGTLYRFDDGFGMERIGKKAAGRRLDGREHDDFPTP